MLFGAGTTLAQDGRNRALAELPDNTWVRLNVPRLERNGGNESRLAYDAKNKLFFQYGGCSAPYTNESWVFDLGTEKWTLRFPQDLQGAADRPAGGCSRGLAFDSKRGVVWVHGNASNGGAGKGDSGLWACDLATNKWTKPADRGPRLEGNVMVYDSLNDVLVTIGRGDEPKTWIFDLGKQRWEGRKLPAIPLGYNAMTFDPVIGRVVLFDMVSTWTYDVRADSWMQMSPKVEPKGNNARRYAGMTYDTRNKVHLLFGGSGKGAWDAVPTDLYNDTWAYDAKANTWTEMKPRQSPPAGKEHALFAYDQEHNLTVMVEQGYRAVWVYRYKRSRKG
jgi:hypothetical protein